MDIAAWLRSFGLERYEQAFRDNDVDARVLPGLTAKDLREIGVTSVGHRRLLLQAIAALREPPVPAAGPATMDPTGDDAAPAAARHQAERRQLTVMFVDLVGSTALSAQLDPEDLREVIVAYHRCVAEVVGRFEGHVAKYMGDGVLAYFGYPRAHEDDAERAVRAGLSLVKAVAASSPRSDLALHVRVGIATGLVVVGDLIGEGAAREEAVVGETPNLAARLQALAEPDTIVISPVTRRLVGGLFDLADLDNRNLKGFAEPVQAWQVTSERTVESRFEALHEAGLTPLVGREHEMALLLDRWQQARAGEGQVVLLSGEPGIGKSRLTRALHERLAGEPHAPVSCYCSPHHRTTVLHPVIGWLERAAGMTRDDPLGRRLDRLEALLAATGAVIPAVAPLFAALLSLPTEGRYPLPNLSPQRQKEETLAALAGQMLGSAAREPVLLVFEDAQWSDPTSLDLLGLLVERARGRAVLVIITFRPEFAPPWGDQAHVTLLPLERLSHGQGAAMVDRVAEGKALPAEVIAQIVAKTDGVPLFVEELTKTVLESGLLRDEGDRYALAGPLPPLAIPATLQDSLMARLDRLAPVKEVAQTAAALGRDFSHLVLAAVAPVREDTLREALDQLVASGLIVRRGKPPEATYAFKHALVQDTAYESLLRSHRQQLHARIARVLQEEFPETAEKEPEILAHHFAQAKLAEPAVEHWEKAGQRALMRSATREAAADFRKAIEMLLTLPDTPERTRRELGLQIALGGALLAAKGYAAPETARSYDRALELCRRVGDTPQLAVALYGHFVVPTLRGEMEAARQLAEEVQRLAQGQEDESLLMTAHAVAGISTLWRGRLAEACTHLERLLARDDPAYRRGPALQHPQDLRVSSLSFLSLALLLLGHPDQAGARARQALEEAEALTHFGTLAMAQTFDCLLCHLRRDGQAARRRAEAVIALTAEAGAQLFLAFATYFRGWARIEEGEREPGLVDMQEGLAGWRATGAGLHVPYLLALLGEALGKAGEGVEGARLVDEGRDLMEQTGERWFEAELHRLRGERLLALPDADRAEAEVYFRRALRISREQETRFWELRAATSLARLWRDHGQRAEARDLLAPVYSWFTEGFDTPDLKDAKAVLEELALTPPWPR